MSSKPSNTSLYNRIKAQAKKKFKVWPSAYASGWVVKEYKRRGGKYSGSKSKSKSKGISRWYKEKWINVCKLPRKVACGRSKSSKKNYPYCRPSKRISSSTPRLASSLSKQEIKRRCSAKRKNPSRRILPSRRRKSVKSRRRSKSKRSRRKSRRRSKSKRSKRKSRRKSKSRS